MAKRILPILIAAIISVLPLFGCGGEKEIEYPEEETAEKFSGTAEYVPISEVTEGKIAAYIFMDKFLDLNEYTAVQEGVTYATVLLVTTEQSVYSKKIKKGDEMYFYTDSSSSLAKTQHTARFSGDTVSFIEDGEIKTADISEYGGEYGITFRDRLIEGFVVNDKTVLSSGKTEEDGNYKITLELDGNIGGYYVRTQMKKIGGLNTYPVFKSVRIILTLDEEYFPLKIKLVAKYSAKKGVINASCEQNLVTTYQKTAEYLPPLS